MGHQFPDMIQFPEIFHENFHMDKALFDELFNKLERYLQPTRDTRPDAIPPEHRLALTLE